MQRGRLERTLHYCTGSGGIGWNVLDVVLVSEDCRKKRSHAGTLGSLQQQKLILLHVWRSEV